MSHACAICRHPKRHEIEQAELTGVPARAIAEQFSTPANSFSRMAIGRHRPHMQELIAAANERLQLHGDDLAGQVGELIARARMLGEKAEQASDLRGAVMAVREMGRLLELTAKLSGELDQAAKHLHVHLPPTREQALGDAELFLLSALDRCGMRRLVRELEERLAEPELPVLPAVCVQQNGSETAPVGQLAASEASNSLPANGLKVSNG